MFFDLFFDFFSGPGRSGPVRVIPGTKKTTFRKFIFHKIALNLARAAQNHPKNMWESPPPKKKRFFDAFDIFI